MALAGTDLQNCIKQAAEFGITRGGARIATLLVQITDVVALGQQTCEGMVFTDSFYWDQSEAARTWSRRYMAKMTTPPGLQHAAVYTGVTHWLKAVKEVGSTEVISMTIYPQYAVVELLEGSGPGRTRSLYYDGEFRENSIGTTTDRPFDIGRIDAEKLAHLSRRARLMVDDADSWYVIVRAPDATSMMRRKICSPACCTVSSPSSIAPQLMSMSSLMRRYIALLVASFSDGEGLQP